MSKRETNNSINSISDHDEDYHENSLHDNEDYHEKPFNMKSYITNVSPTPGDFLLPN